VVVFGLSGMIFFLELVTLIDIMLLGHWIEMKSVMGASEALEDLVRLIPPKAHKIMLNGEIKDFSIHKLDIGDKILIKPGEKIPADGEVIEGETSVNESLLTGESKPVYKKIGSAIIGGSINGEGSITTEVMKTGKDSFISQVIELVKKAQESKSKTQDLANRAAMWLTIIALVCGSMTLITWLLIMNTELVFALERTVTVMVNTYPHALGLAVPVSIAISAKKGLLVRSRIAFEKARKINAVIFDKTGTLTKGEFGVTSQPFGIDETIKGAVNRARGAYSDDFDFSVGIESGLMETPNSISGYADLQWCAIFDGEKTTLGVSAGFEYPPCVIKEVLDGKEVGDVMDNVTGVRDLGEKTGAVNYLSKGMLNRTENTEQCLLMAMIPWLNEGIYFKS